ncbi:probable calcium-binding protein CML41 [Phoenix dactylifera]|uniref:Probable calcium-binding protein CML41 n=1 Tax=Phoenix dactylifera TaxID=42345 RepID=A0A8B7CYK3_PHODC|nr:probable calcium-binding protein CML41 [Phoenix dactylifera]
MANVAISKPSKRFSRKSFKLNLPFLCHQVDVSAPPATVSSPPSSRTKDRIDELRDVFRHFDQDRDGKISGRELRAFFVSIGEEIPVEESEAVIAELDSDGDQLLDFGDFVGLMEREGGGEEDEDLRKAFEMFEVVKGSGRITPRGVQRMLRLLGDERSFEECKAMIRAYDLDGDGELDFHEFHRMMS